MARRRPSTQRPKPSGHAVFSSVKNTSPGIVWGISVALVAVTLATYAAVRDFDYVELDDPVYVTENAQVRAGLTLEGVRWAFTTGTAANWHPLTWLSHMLDVSLFGVSPGPHHLVNLVLHVASTLLLFLLLNRMTTSPWRSGFVAAVFALHPLHVESVAWVAERKDVLSACFWMLTMTAYVDYVRRPSRLRMAAVTGIFALGLMAKPMLVTLPFVLLLLDLWPLQRWSRSELRALIPLVKEKLPLFALTAASSIITVVVQSRGGAMAGLQTVPLGLRVENAITSASGYLSKMIWPVDLSLLYSLPDSVSVSHLAVSLLVLATITVLAFRSISTRPFLLVGWLWYLGTQVPVSGIIQVGVQAMADRYTYIPMIGIAIMVAWAPGPSMVRSSAARAILGGAGLALVVAMAVLTRARLPVWQNNVTLFTDATMHTMGVDEYAAHLALGATLLQEKRFDEARVHYQRANELRPKSAEATYGMGLAYLHAGRAAEAIGPLEEAVVLAPEDPNPRNDLAVSYVRANRIDDAIREYRRLTVMRPNDPRFAQALTALLARRQ
jgi:hypothetical protein